MRLILCGWEYRARAQLPRPLPPGQPALRDIGHADAPQQGALHALLGESFLNDSGASRRGVADVCLAVIASEAKQSILPRKERMDCFASLAMTAVALWIASRSLSSGAHSRDPLARNDGPIGLTEADGTTVPLTLS